MTGMGDLSEFIDRMIYREGYLMTFTFFNDSSFPCLFFFIQYRPLSRTHIFQFARFIPLWRCELPCFFCFCFCFLSDFIDHVCMKSDLVFDDGFAKAINKYYDASFRISFWSNMRKKYDSPALILYFIYLYIRFFIKPRCFAFAKYFLMSSSSAICLFLTSSKSSAKTTWFSPAISPKFKKRNLILLCFHVRCFIYLNTFMSVTGQKCERRTCWFFLSKGGALYYS